MTHTVVFLDVVVCLKESKQERNMRLTGIGIMKSKDGQDHLWLFHQLLLLQLCQILLNKDPSPVLLISVAYQPLQVKDVKVQLQSLTLKKNFLLQVSA